MLFHHLLNCHIKLAALGSAGNLLIDHWRSLGLPVNGKLPHRPRYINMIMIRPALIRSLLLLTLTTQSEEI